MGEQGEVTTPLKVRTAKGGRIWAEASDGTVVVEGIRGRAAGPDFATLETAHGTWHVRRPENRGEPTAVLDALGRQVATYEKHLMRRGELTLAGGETLPVTGARLSFSHSGKLGDLAHGKAPFLRPGRHYTLTLSEALLARDDRELLTALAAHLIQTEIDASIQASVQTPA